MHVKCCNLADMCHLTTERFRRKKHLLAMVPKLVHVILITEEAILQPTQPPFSGIHHFMKELVWN